MDLHIQLEGLEDVTAMLNRLGEGAERGLQQGLLRGGEAVRAEAIAVNEVMQADGWIRELSRDLPKGSDDKYYHKTMRYKKEIF